MTAPGITDQAAAPYVRALADLVCHRQPAAKRLGATIEPAAAVPLHPAADCNTGTGRAASPSGGWVAQRARRQALREQLAVAR